MDTLDFFYSIGYMQIRLPGCKIRSQKNDVEELCIGKYRKMQKGATIGNSRDLYRLIRDTGPWKSNVGEVIEKSDGTLVLSQDRQLLRSAEH